MGGFSSQSDDESSPSDIRSEGHVDEAKALNPVALTKSEAEVFGDGKPVSDEQLQRDFSILLIKAALEEIGSIDSMVPDDTLHQLSVYQEWRKLKRDYEQAGQALTAGKALEFALRDSDSERAKASTAATIQVLQTERDSAKEAYEELLLALGIQA